MLNSILPAPGSSGATRAMTSELGPIGQSAKALGKALANGDRHAAQTAFRSMIKDIVGRCNGMPAPQPMPLPIEKTGGSPTPSSTGGRAGSLLNAVA